MKYFNDIKNIKKYIFQPDNYIYKQLIDRKD